VKPGPIAAMIALLVLGFWLAVGPSLMQRQTEATPGASVFSVDIGTRKIHYERLDDPDRGPVFRFLTDAPDLPDVAMDADHFSRVMGEILVASSERHWLLIAFNISSWWNMAWIAVGFGGQAAFFGRMMLQWVVSERSRQSVVPAAFWWLSLLGGAALFSYFVWRRDVVGVLGQSTGVVIYARNLRLIYKSRRRERRIDAAAV